MEVGNQLHIPAFPHAGKGLPVLTGQKAGWASELV